MAIGLLLRSSNISILEVIYADFLLIKLFG